MEGEGARSGRRGSRAEKKAVKRGKSAGKKNVTRPTLEKGKQIFHSWGGGSHHGKRFFVTKVTTKCD